MKYLVETPNASLEVDVDGPVVRVQGGEDRTAELVELPGNPVLVLRVDGRVFRVLARVGSAPGHYILNVGGYRIPVEALDRRRRALRALAAETRIAKGPANISAPMPGLIVRVLVGTGDQIALGQGVVVMEAMKMENELRAQAAGTVKRVLVEPGAAVERGAVLLELET